jgi:hypothetical protein
MARPGEGPDGTETSVPLLRGPPRLRHQLSRLNVPQGRARLDPTPSAADISITKRLAEAGEMMGIALLDHLVVVPGGAWRSCKL